MDARKLTIRCAIFAGLLAVSISGDGLHAAPSLWRGSEGGNGNYYQYFPGSFDWEEARSNAESLIFRGARGHLATITSGGENEFIASLLPARAWIGGTDSNGRSSEGQYIWAVGPETRLCIAAGDWERGLKRAYLTEFADGEEFKIAAAEFYAAYAAHLCGEGEIDKAKHFIHEASKTYPGIRMQMLEDPGLAPIFGGGSDNKGAP